MKELFGFTAVGLLFMIWRAIIGINSYLVAKFGETTPANFDPIENERLPRECRDA